MCLFCGQKWVNVTLFNASGLTIPQGYGEISSNGDRVTAKIQDGQDFDYALFTELLQQAARTL
ncbi:hypothetical protein KDH_22520 [Dictyobacter sp. S3.2.2.5]|uniref:Uncharacterized protein n=1 Tax=Dictyobacter halimunensis TaxID=3026934 RepID=A0ABQ6FMF2_9CHLR|nr:hypothetical protein KDH_22520 [Dictyobacter sp. S3.2.2.5]